MTQHMGLFTFYLQQLQSETPETPQNISQSQTHPNCLFLQLAQPSLEELEESSSPIELQQKKQTPKASIGRRKMLTKVITDQKIKRKVFSQVKSPEYSNSKLLKAHLKDLTTLKDIVEKSNTHPPIPNRHKTEKSSHQESTLKGYDLNQDFNQIAKQLQLQVQQFRNNKKNGNRHSLLTLVPPTSNHPLRKKARNKRLPTLKKPWKQLKTEVNMNPLGNPKKMVSKRWKNPNKQSKETYLEPIFSDRNQQYGLKVEILTPRDLKKKTVPLRL